MSRLKSLVRQAFMSPGEAEALRLLFAERAIASYHRSGIRQIRKQSLGVQRSSIWARDRIARQGSLTSICSLAGTSPSTFDEACR